MTNQTKSLDYHLIERASDKYENIKEVVVFMEIDNRIESFIVETYKHFSPLQISQCVQELVQKLDHVRVKDNKKMASLLVPYMMFLIVKHFTTLELPSDLPRQLKAIENMINTSVLFQIFIAFEQEEIEKVQSEVSYVLENFEKNNEYIEKFKEEIKDKLIDKSLLEM